MGTFNKTKLASPDRVDLWFDVKTQNLNDIAKAKLKENGGPCKSISSHPRLKMIADEILLDMATKPRLVSGQGNAMLVASRIPEAQILHNLKQTLGKQYAIVTSYSPNSGDIRTEDSGKVTLKML